METGEVLAKGAPGFPAVVSGQIIEWREQFLGDPRPIAGKIVYIRGGSPLYRAALLADNGAKGVVIAGGGRNYHPLILLSDARTPCIAGVGDLSLEQLWVTLDSCTGSLYVGEQHAIPQPLPEKPETLPQTTIEVYVNVGYPSAIGLAAKSGADGIGLLRTEFTAVRTLSRILNDRLSDGKTVRESIESSSEADVIYALSRDSELRQQIKDDLKSTFVSAMRSFAGKQVNVRTFDLARGLNEPMGNRGIRRCIAEGGDSITVIGEAVRESIEEAGDICGMAVILPLVSDYSQIRTALSLLLKTRLRLYDGADRGPSIKFGWEIEQPAACVNHGVWMTAFQAEYRRTPDLIGIGTNDLTQFTVALGRDASAAEKDEDVKKYLESLYDESDFCVIRQLHQVSQDCAKAAARTRLFVLGQAAARDDLAEVIMAMGITPSVDIGSVGRVRKAAMRFEGRGNPTEEVLTEYVDRTCDKYYPWEEVRAPIRQKLLATFGLGR